MATSLSSTIPMSHNAAPGMMIAGHPGAGKTSNLIGVPMGDSTPVQAHEQVKIFALVKHLRGLLERDEYRQFRFISKVFDRKNTVGKLHLLHFYNRYMALDGDPGMAYAAAETITPMGMNIIQRITAANVEAVGKFSLALSWIFVEDKQAVMELVLQQPALGDDITSLIVDRRITDAREITEILTEMRSNHSSLAEGTL